MWQDLRIQPTSLKTWNWDTGKNIELGIEIENFFICSYQSKTLCLPSDKMLSVNDKYFMASVSLEMPHSFLLRSFKLVFLNFSEIAW